VISFHHDYANPIITEAHEVGLRENWSIPTVALRIRPLATATHLPPSADAAVCTYDIHWGIPALPSAAANRKVYFALVRRRSRYLEHLYDFLSSDASGRLCLRAFQHTMAEASGAIGAAFHIAFRRTGIAANHTCKFLETDRRTGTDFANTCAAVCIPGTALFCIIFHRSHDAVLVKSHPSGQVALPIICALELRFTARVAELSILFREPFGSANSGTLVGLGTGALHPMLGFLPPPLVAPPRGSAA
jgi:hypothetical protein